MTIDHEQIILDLITSKPKLSNIINLPADDRMELWAAISDSMLEDAAMIHPYGKTEILRIGHLLSSIEQLPNRVKLILIDARKITITKSLEARLAFEAEVRVKHIVLLQQPVQP